MPGWAKYSMCISTNFEPDDVVAHRLLTVATLVKFLAAISDIVGCSGSLHCQRREIKGDQRLPLGSEGER